MTRSDSESLEIVALAELLDADEQAAEKGPE